VLGLPQDGRRLKDGRDLMPKVSVIVPNYDHARFLSKRIESILRQSYQDFELILLDDCSTDDSRAILSQYAGDERVRLEFNATNSGSPFKQWNKGVALARGEYVWIAESDDYADERLLECLVRLLEIDPGVAFAYCRSWRITERDQHDGFADFYFTYLDASRWATSYCVDGHDECKNYSLFHNTVPNASGVVFRKAIYDLVGGADENFRLCGDWKLWAAMALTGRVAYSAEPLNFFRFHEASVRNKSIYEARNVAESLRVCRWILERVTPTDAAREKLCEMYSFYWVPAIMSTHVPSDLKRSILSDVKAIDRHVLRRLLRPAFVTLRLKFARHFHFVRRRT
jgi:glycosyltransferase involved in cell wall biosynthesis